MEYFKQAAREFIQATTVYYEETRDDEIATVPFRELLFRIKNNPRACLYITSVLALFRQEEETGYIGPVPAVIASVKKIWKEEYFSALNVSLQEEEQPSEIEDIRFIVSLDRIEILDIKKESVIKGVQIDANFERSTVFDVPSVHVEHKLYFISLLLNGLKKTTAEVKITYYNHFGQRTDDLADAAFAIIRSHSKLG